METAEAAVMPSTAPRWFMPTPGRCVLLLLAIEAVLFLSSRFHWFPFNEHKGYTVLITIATVGVALLLMLLWFVVSLVFRWRFQFSIRSLLVLTVVVAVPCSWLAVEMKKAREQRNAVEAISKLGGATVYDYERSSLVLFEPKGWAWQRMLLGDEFFNDVSQCTLSSDAEMGYLEGLTQLRSLCAFGTQITDAGWQHLERLTQLEELLIDGTQITDAGLKHMVTLTQLEHLILKDTQITDAGLEHLKGLTRLQSLYLGGTQVTDAGLKHLKELTQLQTLDLDDTQVTDAGLEHLTRLTQLKNLRLNGTQVTAAGAQSLRKALPNCDIQCEPRTSPAN